MQNFEKNMDFLNLNIKYWSLGNEMDGPWQMGHMNAEDYSKKAREAAKLMVRTSPGIKLIAAGSSNYRARRQS